MTPDAAVVAVLAALDADWAYLDRWSTVHGTASLLGEIRATVPIV